MIAHRDMAKPQLVFDRGWWESMSENSLEPNPSNESTRNGRVVLSYDKLSAGQTLIAWLYFQVNPTNVGRRSQNVWLYDGQRRLATVRRTMTIWP